MLVASSASRFFYSTAFWQLITILASLAAAWIGGRIAGKYALRAQQQAARDQLERDRQNECRALLGTLQSIQAELSVLKADRLDPLQKRLKEHPPGMFPTSTAQQNYFNVFESNAAVLTKIGNPQLLNKIVSVYGQAKGLVDAMNFNYRRFEAANRLILTEGKGPDSQEVKYAIVELTGLRTGIEHRLETLLTDIPKYLAELTSDKNAEE